MDSNVRFLVRTTEESRAAGARAAIAKPKLSVSWRYDLRQKILYVYGSNLAYDMRITRMIVVRYLDDCGKIFKE